MRRYRAPALLTVLALSVLFGAAFIRSAWMTTDLYTVDTISIDAELRTCTSSPNDCSIVGAIANANTDGHSSTVDFDEGVFASHETIRLDGGFALAEGGKLTVNGPPAGVTLSLDPTHGRSDDGRQVRRLFALFEPDMELEIRNLTLTGGNTFQGAGIYNDKGKVTVTHCVITGNTSTQMGGGITNSNGKFVVINSTITGNSSLSGGGVVNSFGEMWLVNTIISNNDAPVGGGIRNEAGTLTLVHTTVIGNSASSGGGGLSNFSGTTNLYNSMIAGNTAGGDCQRSYDDINAEHSLIEDGLTCVNGTNKNNLTGDPGLVSQADNWMLLPGSIAIDAGSAASAVDAAGVALPTDRRGARFPRIVGGGVDLGAFEYQSPTRKEQCKNEGWRNYSNPAFSDQDQCIVHVVRPDPLQ